MKYLLACIVFFSIVAEARMFVGYDSFCGLPVIVERTSQSAVATIRSGQRVIIVDPSVMDNWRFSRVFVIAHECAHHILGHLSPSQQFQRQHMNATRRQEIEADCWAARTLANNGYIREIQRAVVQNASQGPIMQGPYPSGMERAEFIANCAGVNIAPSRQIPPPARLGTICQTNFGACSVQSAPVSTSCACFSPATGHVPGFIR
ncbi:MAG: hypothetical protein C9356_02800 [Oleiphilus sp.]|nr:MAG: hypothetical protein C9356_02800 [Oleiphilus sp.]